jgi:glycosyltransferase involved in cell wall biosynthesis
MPAAELHIYGGPAVYRGLGPTRVAEMEAILARADTLSASGVRRFFPLGREALAAALMDARVMLYRGDPGETFCLSLAEAQAMGVPAVVMRLGAVGERVVDGVSGRVACSDDDFAATAIEVLREDELWRRWHLGALERQRGLSWDMVAARYEALIP